MTLILTRAMVKTQPGPPQEFRGKSARLISILRVSGYHGNHLAGWVPFCQTFWGENQGTSILNLVTRPHILGMKSRKTPAQQWLTQNIRLIFSSLVPLGSIFYPLNKSKLCDILFSSKHQHIGAFFGLELKGCNLASGLSTKTPWGLGLYPRIDTWRFIVLNK